MKTIMPRRFVLLSLLAGAAVLPSASQAGVDLPKRKPGHWELTTVSPETGMTTSETCIGPDDNLVASDQMGSCSEPKVTPAGSEIIVDVVCWTAAGKQSMSTVLDGDFSTRYHATMKIAFDPPPENAARTLGVTIDGKYLGTDCASSTP